MTPDLLLLAGASLAGQLAAAAALRRGVRAAAATIAARRARSREPRGS